MKSISKIGLIDFANCLPVLLPIIKKRLEFDFELVLGSPQQLNRLMANGELDAASVSLFYYLEQRERLELIKTISISSFSPVGSVELYSKLPIGELDGRTIQVPKSSATSVNMMRVLLLEEFGVKPHLVEMDEPDCFDLNADAALVIGDRALLVEDDWTAKGPIKIDLASWWFNWTKLPAVFGVWVLKKSLQDLDSKESGDLSNAFAKARDIGLGELMHDVIAEAKLRFGGKLDETRLLRYYKRELNFDFSVLHLESIDFYSNLCHKYDLLNGGK